MTVYLTADDLCFLNAMVGGPGLPGADIPGVEAAAHRPQGGFGGIEKFPTIWLKAGALLHALCSTQAFLDGNKRTAWTAVDVFLTKNGYPLPDIVEVEAESSVLSVAKELFSTDDEPERTVEMAAEWLETRWRMGRAERRLDILSARVLLRPADPESTLRFYRDQLGLAIAREYPGGVVFFAGSTLIEVASHMVADASGAADATGLWLQVRDLDDTQRTLSEVGVAITREARTEPWGLREMHVADPDGRTLIFVEIPAGHPLRTDVRQEPAS